MNELLEDLRKGEILGLLDFCKLCSY